MRTSLLLRIMVWGSVLAVGFAAASLEALQANFSFKISAWTFVAFAAGATVVYFYWRLVLSPEKNLRQKRLRLAASALLVIAGIGGFLYPLRFIAPNNYPEVVAGLLMAFCGIGVIAMLLVVCKRFLERDEDENR